MKCAGQRGQRSRNWSIPFPGAPLPPKFDNNFLWWMSYFQMDDVTVAPFEEHRERERERKNEKKKKKICWFNMAARDVAKVMRCCVLSVCVRGVSVCWWVRLVTKSIRVPGEACNLVLLPPFLTFYPVIPHPTPPPLLLTTFIMWIDT